MLRHLKPKELFNKHLRWVFTAILVAALFGASLPRSSADVLGTREIVLASSVIGAITQYNLNFVLPSSSTYGSLDIEICSNDPFPGRPCTVPVGLNVSSAVLSAQSGPSGFVIKPGATSNHLVLTRVPAVAPAGPASYTFQQVTNPSSPGSYFVRLQTFASSDATGSRIYEGGAVFATTNSISVTATVAPYLIFCTGITIPNLNCANATGDYIDFGELSSKRTSKGTSQMLAATNAQSGYNVTIQGTTMTSGANEIAAMASPDVSRPGTSQFGMNLTVNSTPAVGGPPAGPGTVSPVANYSVANTYRFVNGETLATTNAPDDVRVFTASYIANVPPSQAPGIYVTTITYICLATF